MAILKPSTQTKTFESDLAVFWIEDGILHALAKNTPRSLEKQKETYALLKNLIGDKKICLLSDTTRGAPHDKVTRDYTAAEMPNLFIAIAVVSGSPLGNVITNTFLAIKKQPIPLKLFANEKDAKKWLKQYL